VGQDWSRCAQWAAGGWYCPCPRQPTVRTDIPQQFAKMMLLNKFPNISDVALHNLSAPKDCEKRPFRVLINKFQNQLLEDVLVGFGTKVSCTVSPVPENSVTLETPVPVSTSTGPLWCSHNGSHSVVQSSLFAQTIGFL